MRALLIRALVGAVFYGVVGSLTGGLAAAATFADWSMFVDDWTAPALALIPLVFLAAVFGVVPGAITGFIMGATLPRWPHGHSRKIFGGAILGAACSAAYCGVVYAPELFFGRQPFFMPDGPRMLGLYLYAGAVGGGISTWLFHFAPEGRSSAT